jgi:hypothetical protein
LSVVNLIPLSPGRYEFSLVLIVTDQLISAPAVLNILSPSKVV